ncbi:MAG: pyruvate kinase [Thermocladium sp.]|jgi:pyruvate kinase|nr:MAG: pyruvate kinase [Thermocladium sp. ECH_B]
MHRVKLMASIGPATDDPATFQEVAKHIDGARINFSHGDPQEWGRRVSLIRGAGLPILGDLRGPGVRTGLVHGEIIVKAGETIVFKYGQEATGGEVPVPIKEFFAAVEPRDVLVMNDGRLKLIVESKDEKTIKATAQSSGVIGSNKSIDVKGKDYPLPILDDHDKEALSLAVDSGFEFIGISHVRSAKDILEVKSYLSSKGSEAKVIAKMESRAAIDNLKEVVEAADYVMVARGDLGMTFELEEVPIIQQRIVEEALRQGRPVMVATQLLSSMVSNPVPTRAEVVDVMTAVTQGVDALLLTDETTIGKYPIDAVKWLERISAKYEGSSSIVGVDLSLYDYRMRFAMGVAKLASDMGAKIVIFTKSGLTAVRISRFRPGVPILAATPSNYVARQLRMMWGVESSVVKASDYEAGLEEAFNRFLELGLITPGENVVLTYGMQGREAEHLIRVRRA